MALEAAGHEVVYWASDEPDEWWFRDALRAGAELFVSPDWDIVLMADERNAARVLLKNGIRGAEQARPVLREIERMRRKTT